MRYVSNELRGLADPDNLWQVMANLDGEVFREVKSRRTFRFEHGGKAYFAKVHYGVGWREIFKNLLQLRLPVLSAVNEWNAIGRLKQIEIHTLTPVAYSVEGGNPATRRSCIVTAALEDTVSLEDLVAEGPVPFTLKLGLLREVAEISARMHRNGLNHRDLYLCHFHLDQAAGTPGKPGLYLIDLHRAQLRQRTPRRWIVKDVGGLFFSAFDAGLSRADLFRFMRAYSGKRLRRTLREDSRFWRAVYGRARRLYLDEHGNLPAHLGQWRL